MNKILTFRDSHTLTSPKVYADTQNLLGDIFSPGHQKRVGLKTTIRATHSGYLLNQRVYPGVHMRDSSGSWVTPQNGGTASYNKPIILDHNDRDVRETIGRAVSSKFVQIKQGNDFTYDYRRPVQGRDHGSGYIIVGAMITDPDAIVKILDKRYDTVSAGMRPDAALCNLCGFNWLSDSADTEPCEHRPGKRYQIDDMEYPCFLVTGRLTYNELSYLNVPAQPNARTLSANLEALEGLWSNGDSKDGLEFHSYGATADALNYDLFDNEGNQLDLILRDGVEDVLPDIATRFTKTNISVPELEDNDMKKGQKLTTDEADKILDPWIKDRKDRKAEASKDDKVAKDKNKDDKVKDDKNEDTEIITDTSTGKRISDEALSDAIDVIRTERDTLRDEKENLKAEVDEKTELVRTLTDEIKALRKSAGTDAARMLAVIRVITNHPSAEDAGSSSEDFNELVTELSERTVDSLNDAITDSLPQLQDVIRKLRSTDAQTIDAVTDPTLHREVKDSENESGEDDGESKNRLKSKDEFLDDLD